MRAWQLQNGFSLNHLKLASLPEPGQPGPGEVLLRVRAASLNYRDLLVVRGLYSSKLRLPLIIGSDAAGEVAAVGPGVTRFHPGDRAVPNMIPLWVSGRIDEAAAKSGLGAFRQGVLAEYLLFDEQSLVSVPAHLSFEEAATLPCAGLTAWHALFADGHLQASESVLTLGTGGVSLFAVQLAAAAGARVISTTSSEAKARRLLDLGAHDVINYVTNPNWEAAVRELTGAGVDHVIEVGGAPTLPKSIRAARMGASIYMIGNRAEGPAEFNPVPAFMKSLRLIGIFCGSREMFDGFAAFLASHSIRPVVDRVFNFEELPLALASLGEGRHFGKVSIRF